MLEKRFVPDFRFVAGPHCAPQDRGNGRANVNDSLRFIQQPGLKQRLPGGHQAHLHALSKTGRAVLLQVVVDGEALDLGCVPHRVQLGIQLP